MSGVVKAVTSIPKAIGNTLGLTGGAEDAQQYASDPAAFKELYEQALSGIQGVGKDEASLKNRRAIEGILSGQLEGLEDNAAGRKQNFMEDMSRGFQADVQNLARARGGTGTLAQALRPSGEMYDSQARATSRGLNDLYSQATQDLGSLQGVQGNLYSQDMGKQTQIANLAQNELASRRGTSATNLDNQWDAEQAKNRRFGDTLKGVAQGVGAVASPHTFAGKLFGGGR